MSESTIYKPSEKKTGTTKIKTILVITSDWSCKNMFVWSPFVSLKDNYNWQVKHILIPRTTTVRNTIVHYFSSSRDFLTWSIVLTSCQMQYKKATELFYSTSNALFNIESGVDRKLASCYFGKKMYLYKLKN